MKLVNFEDDDFKIPKLKSDSLLCMRSVDFSHICRDLANISDTVSLGFLKRGINLSVKSDFAQGNISICDNDTMNQEDSKENSINPPQFFHKYDKDIEIQPAIVVMES